MAPAIAHFLIGAALALLLVAPFVLRYELDLRWGLWLVPIGGLWGLLPDVHHVAPVFRDRLNALHHSPWMDLFAFHYLLDRPTIRGMYVESVFGSVLVFLLAVAAFSAAQHVGARARPPRTPGEVTAVRATSAVVAAGYAAVVAGAFVFNLGQLGQVGALVGREGLVAGGLVLVALSAVGGLVYASVLETAVPIRYRTRPFAGALVGIPFAVAAWFVVVGFLTPLWVRAIHGGAVAVPFLQWPSLIGVLSFGVTFGLVYATVRGAFAPETGAQPTRRRGDVTS